MADNKKKKTVSALDAVKSTVKSTAAAVKSTAAAVKKTSEGVKAQAQSGGATTAKKVSSTSGVKKNSVKKSGNKAKKGGGLKTAAPSASTGSGYKRRYSPEYFIKNEAQLGGGYDRRFTPAYFENNSRYTDLYKKNDADMTAGDLAETIDMFRRIQAGENYRTKQGTGSYTSGENQYNMNDAVNRNRSKQQWDAYLAKASEADISDTIKTWEKYLEEASVDAESDYAKRTQEDLDALKNYARKNYSAYNEGEMIDYSARIAQNNRRLKELGAFGKGNSADAGAVQSALDAMGTGNDPISMVERDEALRRVTGYDSLLKKYGDNEMALSDAIRESLNSYMAGAYPSDEEKTEIERLSQENSALNRQMKEAAEQRDKLARRNYLKGLAGSGNAEGFSVPEYSAYGDPLVYDERGNRTGDVRYNAPTLEQIIDNPEAVYEEYQKYQAATGASGYAETIGLARHMTEDERNAYRAIYANYGSEIANEWFENIKPTLEARETQALAEDAQGLAKEHPIIGGALSIATNELAKRQRQADMIRTILGGEPSERQQEALTEALRGTALNELAENTDWATFEIDGHEYNPFNMLAQGGLSTGDEKLATVITGPWHLLDMGLDAMASAYLDSYEKYGDREAALLTGLGSGASEYMSEYAGDVFVPTVDMGGSTLRSLAQWGLNSAGEGFEEVLSSVGSEIGNEISYLLTGHGGDMQDDYNYLTANGYSPKEALGILAKQFGLDAVDEFAVGAIAGGMMGAGSAVNSAVQERAANTGVGQEIAQRGSVAEVLEAGLKSKDRSTRKIAQGLVDKLNLTDSSRPVLSGDAKTQAELQYVQEAVNAEQKADNAEQKADNAKQETDNKQQQADNAKQQANNEQRTEAKMREPSRALTKKEARQVGRVYRQVLRALDVQVSKDNRKLSKELKKRLSDFGEEQLQEVTDAIADVALLGEDAPAESVTIAEAAAARDGVIKEIFTGLKQDVGKIIQFNRAAFTKGAQTAGNGAESAAAGSGDKGPVKLMAAQAERGNVEYTTDAGETVSGAFNGFEIAQDGGMAANVGGQSVPVDRLEARDLGTDTLIRRAVELADADRSLSDSDRRDLADIMYYAYEDGQDVERYTRGFEAAYHYAEAGMSRESAQKRPGVKGLSEAQFEAAYEAGESVTQARPQAATSGGEVRYAEGLKEKIRTLGSGQRAAVNAITKLATELKAVNIEFFESQADEGGSYMAYENGSYDPATNTLRIDINAGRNSESDVAEYAMLRTASHELTHYIKSQNASAYGELLDYVAENLMDGGENAFDALVEEKMESQSLNYRDAVEEVVADGCEMMLKDSAAVEQLAKQNRSLFRRVQRWIKNFTQSVKRAFQGVSARSLEARLLEKAEGLQKLWDNALVGAVENVRKGGTEGSVESKQAERKYPKRDATDDAAHIEEAKRYFGTTADFREAGYLLTDGKMLNFSDAATTEDSTNTGDIRLIEKGRIQLQQAPTKAQEAVLERFIKKENGYVPVNFYEKGDILYTFVYGMGTDSTKVINDIRAYYADDKIPTKKSGVTVYEHSYVKYSKRAGVEFMEDKYYARLIDQIEEQNSNRNIKVGSIEEDSVLNQVGLPAAGLYFDVSKINRQLENHSDHITKETLKKIPDILRDPIVIAEAKADTISVFGEVVAGNSPVMVGIVVTTDRRGHNLINKVRTIHARRNYAQQIVDENILYLNEDKKRTQNWFKARDIIVPLGGTKYGFIRSIAQPVESVKQSPRRKTQLTDREILVNAFGYVAQDNAEYEYLEKYRKQIDSLNEKEAQRKRVQNAIREKMLSDEPRGTDYTIEMNRMRAEAKRLANEIDRMDRKLLNLERAKPLQDVLAREQQKAKENAMKLLHEGQARNRERRTATEYRQRIRRVADSFDRKLKNPTQKNYIPQTMVGMSVKMRELVNTASGREGEKAKAKIAEIKEMYNAYKEDPLFSYVHDEVLDSMLDNLGKMVGDRTIYQLNPAELKEVYDVMNAIKKQVEDAAKLKSMYAVIDGKEANVIEVGKALYRETAEAEPVLRGAMSDYLNWQLTPDKFFARIGGYVKGGMWEMVGRSFSRGTEKMLEVKRAASNHFGRYTSSSQFDRLGSTKDSDMVDIGLRDEKGNVIKVTRGMMLEAYMHLSSTDNRRGFRYGGFSVPNIKKYYAGKVAESYGTGSINSMGAEQEMVALMDEIERDDISQKERDRLTDELGKIEERSEERIREIYDKIEEQLTDWDRGLIEAVHEWNDGTSRDYINEVTMDLYGFRRAGVENYYPIHRDTNFLKTDFESVSKNMNLVNWGALKERVKSRVPILLGDISYTLANSIDQTSRYVGYARVQTDFNKLYNVRMPGMSGSVKKAVSAKFGTGKRIIGVSGAQYIENFIGSITGSRGSEGDWTQAIRRNLPRATMSFNYRVGFSQLSAIPKAAQEVGWDCLLEGLKNGGIRAIVSSDARRALAQKNVFFWDRYNGEGGEREFADAKGGTDPISRAWNWLDDKTKGWVLNLNQKMDVAATVSMYPMAEAWVRRHTNAKEGTAEFDALANEKYTDILRNTQAANTLTEKNDLARSPNGLNSMLTMYKSEAFANFNILYDSIAKAKKYSADLKAGRNGVTQADVKQARGKIASAATSVVVASSLMNAVIKLGVNAIFSTMNGYRDDDDEVNLRSIANTILGEMTDDATGMLTFGGELYDVLKAMATGEKYYDPSPAALEEVITIAKAAVSLTQKEDATAEDYAKAAEKMVMSACTMLGVPLENAKRQAVGAANTIKDVVAGRPMSFEASADRSNGTNYARLLDATIRGDEKKTDTVMAELTEKGVEEKDVQTGYRAKLKEAFKTGKADREKTEELLVEYGGKNADEAYWLVEEWEDADGEYSRYDALREALTDGDRSGAAQAIDELISHGVKDSSVAAEITELYKSGEATTILALQLRPSRLYTPSKPKGDKDDFNAYFDALLSGRDTSEEVKKLRKLGYNTRNIMTALNGAFGNKASRYAYMTQNNPSEGRRLEELILNAYEVLGLKREEERAWIRENWVMQDSDDD